MIPLLGENLLEAEKKKNKNKKIFITIIKLENFFQEKEETFPICIVVFLFCF